MKKVLKPGKTNELRGFDYEEYAHLQQLWQDYPRYTVVLRHMRNTTQAKTQAVLRLFYFPQRMYTRQIA